MIIQDYIGLQFCPSGTVYNEPWISVIPPAAVPPGDPPAFLRNLGDSGRTGSTSARCTGTGMMENVVEPLERCVEVTGGRRLFAMTTPKMHVQAKSWYLR
ncbi:hypothetical protein M427DRAFT_33361 [Gonapodya prolifera JEL478]|uniref:Uncharacterized protein n=1 Tax=Gonapodya prolifera (strain JEL478) TaxID=1344416 RepID=A0A139ACJ6_GONPJ|nr:hypothetical protein M427DRAFT_33361 [Gonapodya prolifera JEL478]|eukprot:KXS14175.1 hypothetical protein M427DRAFT_33361 [Gonapodya prolifera JEL478]